MVVSGKKSLKLVAVFAVVAIAVATSFLRTSQAVQVNQVTPNSGGTAGGEAVTLSGDFSLQPTTMQEMTAEYCGKMTVYDGTNPATIKTLHDPRGPGQNYLVAKLADGNCWMLNNLKLGSTSSELNLTPADTNIPVGWTMPQVNAGGTSSSTQDASQPTADALLSSEQGYDSGLPNSEETDITSDNFAGYFYNWCTATGGDPATCTDNNTMPAEPTGDICPANWRMPTGGPTGEYAVLNGSMFNGVPSPPDTSYDSAHGQNWRFDGPFRSVFAGYYIDWWGYQGVYGNLWTSTPDPDYSDYAYYLYTERDFVEVNIFADRYFKMSIRCVLSANSAPEPEVTFDGVLATVTAWDDGSVTVVAPPHAAGFVDVVVKRGSQSFTLAGGYEYVASAISPIVPAAPNSGRK
jgi:hypothetical protein